MLKYDDVAYTPTRSAAGSLTSDGFAKLSDAEINALPSPESEFSIFKLSDSVGPTIFVRTSSSNCTVHAADRRTHRGAARCAF